MDFRKLNEELDKMLNEAYYFDNDRSSIKSDLLNVYFSPHAYANGISLGCLCGDYPFFRLKEDLINKVTMEDLTKVEEQIVETIKANLTNLENDLKKILSDNNLEQEK